MKDFVLKSQFRDIEGPKAKSLRKNGFVPGVVFGKGLDSVPVQISTTSLKKFVKEGHNIFQLEVENKGTYMVSLDHIDKDQIGKEWLHVSFHELKKGQEAIVSVPLVVKGTAKGTKSGGVFNQHVHEVYLVGLPSKIPQTFEVDVTELDAQGQWKLGELTPPAGTHFKETELEHAIFSCSVPKLEAIEETEVEPSVEVASETSEAPTDTDKKVA